MPAVVLQEQAVAAPHPRRADLRLHLQGMPAMSRTRLLVMFLRYDLLHWLRCLSHGVSPAWLWGWQQRANYTRRRIAESRARND